MATGNILTDAGGRHAPALDTDVNTLKGKLILNQGGEDDGILQKRSSDVAHGITDFATTDTYAVWGKFSSSNGGLSCEALTAGIVAYGLNADYVTGDVAKSNAASGPVVFNARKKSGTGIGAPAANENIAVFQANGLTRQILDSDGDSHQDVGTAWTNFDICDDLEVLNALAAHVTRRDDPLRDTFRQWLEQPEYRRVLEKYRLVTFNDDGHHFVNMSRLTMLLCGAIRQMGQAMSAVYRRLDTLEYRLAPAGASGTLPR
jgi:hypothetical protein